LDLLAVLFDWTFATKEASLAHVGEGGKMDEDRRELIRSLFAAATARLETAHEIAIDGQSADLSFSEYQACAGKLCSISADIDALAIAAAALSRIPGSSSDEI
jgi:hypothetical protein